MGRNNSKKVDTAQDLGLEGISHPDDDHGLSLEDLSEAYALIDGGADPYQPEEIDDDEPEEDEFGGEEEAVGEVEVTPQHPRSHVIRRQLEQRAALWKDRRRADAWG